MRVFTCQDLYDETREKNDIILVDLDGTLSEHTFPGPLGPPKPGVLAAVEGYRRAGKTVVIWTGRTNEVYQRTRRLPPGQLAAIFVWCNRYGVRVDGVLIAEKPIFSKLIDDCAVNPEDS